MSQYFVQKNSILFDSAHYFSRTAVGEKKDISQRLETLEIHRGKKKNLVSIEPENADDMEGRHKISVETVVMNTSPLSSFEQDLYVSLVYARNMEEKSNLSIPCRGVLSFLRLFSANNLYCSRIFALFLVWV